MVGQGVLTYATIAIRKDIMQKSATNLQEDVNPEVLMDDASFVMRKVTRKLIVLKEEMVVVEEITDEADLHQGETEAEAVVDQTAGDVIIAARDLQDLEMVGEVVVSGADQNPEACHQETENSNLEEEAEATKNIQTLKNKIGQDPYPPEATVVVAKMKDHLVTNQKIETAEKAEATAEVAADQNLKVLTQMRRVIQSKVLMMQKQMQQL